MATSGQGIGYTGEDLLEEYISAHIGQESILLREIFRETNLKLLNPRMASGHIQGRLLKMLVNMIRPELILEVGTFTGYAIHSVAYPVNVPTSRLSSGLIMLTNIFNRRPWI